MYISFYNGYLLKIPVTSSFVSLSSSSLMSSSMDVSSPSTFSILPYSSATVSPKAANPVSTSCISPLSVKFTAVSRPSTAETVSSKLIMESSCTANDKYSYLLKIAEKNIVLILHNKYYFTTVKHVSKIHFFLIRFQNIFHCQVKCGLLN